MFYFRQILACQFLFKIFTIQSILSLPITSSQKICIRQEKKKTPRKVFKKGKRSFPGTNQSYKKKSFKPCKARMSESLFWLAFWPTTRLVVSGKLTWKVSGTQYKRGVAGVPLSTAALHFQTENLRNLYPSNSIVKLSKVFLSKQTTQKSYLRTLWNAFCRRNLV